MGRRADDQMHARNGLTADNVWMLARSRAHAGRYARTKASEDRGWRPLHLVRLVYDLAPSVLVCCSKAETSRGQRVLDLAGRILGFGVGVDWQREWAGSETGRDKLRLGRLQ